MKNEKDFFWCRRFQLEESQVNIRQKTHVSIENKQIKQTKKPQNESNRQQKNS